MTISTILIIAIYVAFTAAALITLWRIVDTVDEHPQHPFTWKERFFLIVCVLMMGWALATAAEVALTRAEEIALENAKGDDEETARAYERYRDFKDKNGATVTLFGSIIVQSFCARPAAPASSLLPPHAVTWVKLPLLRR